MRNITQRTKNALPLMSRIPHFTGPWLAAFVSSALYLFTLSPGLSFGDSGELIAGAATLGIVHPPGYSLFLLAGRLFLALPVPGDLAWRANLFTALWGVCAVSLLCLLLKRLFRRLPVHESVADISALAGALLFAFSRTWWSQCLITEVYTFQVALVVGLFLALESGRLSLAWFLAGLSWIAHPSSVLVFPLCLWRSSKTVHSFPGKAVQFAALFGLGLSPGLYILLRGVHSPWQDWGQIDSWGKAIEHLTRHGYGGLAWNRYIALGWMLKRYLWSVLVQWTPVGIPVALAGLVILRRWKSIFTDVWLVLFLLTGPVAILLLTGLLSPSQRIDFEPFCLLSYLLLAGLLAAAIAASLERWPLAGGLFAAFLLGLVCVSNGPKVSQAGNTIPGEYAALLTSGIPTEATVVPIKDSTSYALDYSGTISLLPKKVTIDRFISNRGENCVEKISRLVRSGDLVLTDMAPETWSLHRRMKPSGLLMQICLEPLEEPPNQAIHSLETRLGAFQQRVEQRMRANPKSLEGRILSTHFVDLALILEAHNRPDEARQLFNTAIEWNRENVDAHIRLADLAIQRGELHRAQEHLAVAMAVAPYTVSVRLMRGRLRLAENDVDGAIQDWEQVRRIDPADTFSRLLLAKAYLELGQNRKARALLHEILKIKPSHVEAQQLLQESM